MLARNGRPVRAEIVARMLELANAAYSEDGQRVMAKLSPEAEAEIAAALAESDGSQKDPCGIKTIFEEARKR